MRLSIRILIFSFLLNFLISDILKAQDIDCLDCHDNLIENSIHFENLECQDCHVDIDNEDHIDKGAVKVSCADCHEEYSNLVKKDIHHRLKTKVKNAPDCITCHDSHEIKSPSLSTNKTRDYCSQCHESIVLANPYHSEAVENETCFECHESEEHIPLLSQSIHKELNCADCHNYISHNLEGHPDNIEKLQTADCYLCHTDIANVHRESIHGISLLEGVNEAAQCWNCHGSHSILNIDDPNSMVYPVNLAATCGECHDNPEFEEKFVLTHKQPGKMYSLSVHGILLKKEGNGAPNCSSCHGVHDIKSKVQSGSKISSFNIPNTCGKCHKDVTEEYKESIHWIYAKKGAKFSPVCNDCHSEHSIHAVNVANKALEIKKLQEKTCMICHQSEILAERYGLSGAEPKQYQDSYHGLAVVRGDEEAAMCVDCHGAHNILPENFPKSTVNQANVTQTCLKCHDDATDIFAMSYSHETEPGLAKSIEYWVEYIYIWLIIIIIGGMLFHNLIIFISELKNKRKIELNYITIPRYTKNEVIQHLILLISFILLAITGFALRFPESFWVEGLTEIGMTESVRQIIHKSCGIIMLTLGIYHIGYLLFSARGKYVLKGLKPKVSDLKEALNSFLYYLTLKKEKPEFGIYDYTEKAEYWALIWGTIIMGITGLILWFPTIVGDWAPTWLIKVSELVHYYEAILATLAILVWHWFFVIFRPSEYPMNFAWIDGKTSLEHYKNHHKEHFKKIAVEIIEIENNKRELKDSSHFTKLFIKEFEKNNIDPYDAIMSQINEDDDLKNWYDTKINPDE